MTIRVIFHLVVSSRTRDRKGEGKSDEEGSYFTPILQEI